MAWTLRGEYIENCNCDLFCPCLLGPRDPQTRRALARPTQGYCDMMILFHIDAGQYDNVVLDGLNVATAYHVPGTMAEGNLTVAIYLDARAAEDQKKALGEIFRGNAGGPIGRLAPFVKTWQEARVAEIEYLRDGFRRRFAVPSVMEVEVEAIVGRDGKREIWAENVFHGSCARLASAIGRSSWYRDHGFDWNHSGKNAHYGPLDWSG